MSGWKRKATWKASMGSWDFARGGPGGAALDTLTGEVTQLFAGLDASLAGLKRDLQLPDLDAAVQPTDVQAHVEKWGVRVAADSPVPHDTHAPVSTTQAPLYGSSDVGIRLRSDTPLSSLTSAAACFADRTQGTPQASAPTHVISIASMAPGSSADRCGQLQCGDRLLCVRATGADPPLEGEDFWYTPHGPTSRNDLAEFQQALSGATGARVQVLAARRTHNNCPSTPPSSHHTGPVGGGAALPPSSSSSASSAASAAPTSRAASTGTEQESLSGGGGAPPE